MRYRISVAPADLEILGSEQGEEKVADPMSLETRVESFVRDVGEEILKLNLPGVQDTMEKLDVVEKELKRTLGSGNRKLSKVWLPPAVDWRRCTDLRRSMQHCEQAELATSANIKRTRDFGRDSAGR
jgi:hypothetical protein